MKEIAKWRSLYNPKDDYNYEKINEIYSSGTAGE